MRAPTRGPAAHRLAAHRLAGQLARRFARARDGVAAVEFALILNVLMLMYLGTVEITRAVSNDRKITLLARTLADLTARGPVTSTSEIFQAGGAVLAPFPSTDASLRINSVGVYKQGNDYVGKVCSSASNQASGGVDTGKRQRGDVVSVSEAYRTEGMRFVLAEVSMPYKPLFGERLWSAIMGDSKLTDGTAPTGNGPPQLGDKAPWPVRSGDTYNGNKYPEVVMPGATACPEKMSGF